MMSISPPLGQGPAALLVQNAGQVPQPHGMCLMSKIDNDSPYAARDSILILFRPVALGDTVLYQSALIIKELSSVTIYTVSSR